MATSHEDIERYLLATHIPSELVGDGLWVLRDPSWGYAQIVVHFSEPLVVFRVKLFDLPVGLADARKAAIFGRLLELNATEMLQGAYALEGDHVVAVEVMQTQNLDQNEFLAALDSLTMAIVEHRPSIEALLHA
jgi:hypothetical protein